MSQMKQMVEEHFAAINGPRKSDDFKCLVSSSSNSKGRAPKHKRNANCCIVFSRAHIPITILIFSSDGNNLIVYISLSDISSVEVNRLYIFFWFNPITGVRIRIGPWRLGFPSVLLLLIGGCNAFDVREKTNFTPKFYQDSKNNFDLKLN